jgi:hypothetical protein
MENHLITKIHDFTGQFPRRQIENKINNAPSKFLIIWLIDNIKQKFQSDIQNDENVQTQN